MGKIGLRMTVPYEGRVWTVVKGTEAARAGVKINTDFKRGLIREELVNLNNNIEHGAMGGCKEKGLIRSEGKDYVMQDGDIVVFRFNV